MVTQYRNEFDRPLARKELIVRLRTELAMRLGDQVIARRDEIDEIREAIRRLTEQN